MSWFKVDDAFWGHPKVLRIPRKDRMTAVGLWCMAGSYCASQLTDGAIGKHMLEEFGATPKAAQSLVDAGLWVVTGDGYQFHDWPSWQPTRAQVHERRDAEAARKQSWRDSKKAKRTSPAHVPPGHPPDETRDNHVRPGGVRGSSALTRPDPTRPDPKEEKPLPDAAAPSPGAPAAPSDPEPITTRANRLTKTYTDRRKLSNHPAIAGIVRKAINAGHDDPGITEALTRLADDNRPVTADSLRVELEGLPPSRYPNGHTRPEPAVPAFWGNRGDAAS